MRLARQSLRVECVLLIYFNLGLDIASLAHLTSSVLDRIVNSILIALTILVVIARLYTRIVIKRWFGIDDIFILFALLFTCGLTAVVLLANLRYGWDR